MTIVMLCSLDEVMCECVCVCLYVCPCVEELTCCLCACVCMHDCYSSLTLTGQSGSVLAYETRRDTDVWKGGSNLDKNA